MSKNHDEGDDYRERAARSRQQKSERGKFKMPEGENVIRILKTPRDKERHSPSVFVEYLMHRDVGPEKGFVRCGKSISGKGECWLCDKLIPKLEKKGRTKQAAALAPTPIFEVQIAVVEKGKWRGPLRYFMNAGQSAKSLAYKLQGIIQSQKRDYLDPKHGYNIVIQRTGLGKMDTVYEVLGPEEESSKVPKSIMEELKPFVDVLPKYDEDRQKAAYYGKDEEEDMAKEDKKKKKHKREDEEPEEDDEDEDTDSDDEEEEDSDDDEDEDDEPKKKKGKKSKAKKSKKSDDDDDDEDEDSDDEEEDSDDEESDDDEDDEEDDEEEDDEDDEPKKKKGKKGKKSKKSSDDDDEEEEEDDDDEEEDDEESDDDDEESDDDDEDEDERPKKKGKKKKH